MNRQATIPEHFNRYWRVAGHPREDRFGQRVGFDLGYAPQFDEPNKVLLRFSNGELGLFSPHALFPANEMDMESLRREKRQLRLLHVDYLVLLQNAWSPLYAGKPWPRERWLQALKRSQSGKRLEVLWAECPTRTLWFDNTTPICAAEARGVMPADLDHIQHLVEALAPRAVVALGEQAAEAAKALKLKRVLMCPHPASRTLTNELLEHAGGLMKKGWKGSVRLVQRKGHYEQLRPKAA